MKMMCGSTSILARQRFLLSASFLLTSYFLSLLLLFQVLAQSSSFFLFRRQLRQSARIDTYDGARPHEADVLSLKQNWGADD